MRVVITGLLMLFGAVLAPQAVAIERNTAVEVQQIGDLRDEARLSSDKKLPILVMFGAEHCSYCVRLEEDFLKPMIISGDYTDKVLIRRIDLDSSQSVRDFDGKQVTPAELASRYHVSLTPTVVFLDQHGNQLAQKMVGLTTPDYYGGYLDAAIDSALDLLRRNTPLRVKLSALE